MVPARSRSLRLTKAVARGREAALGGPALTLVAELSERFGSRLGSLLAARRWDQACWDDGRCPGFIDESSEMRRAEWRAAAVPEELNERRIDVLGPARPGPLVRGLSSGAHAFVADLEDGLSPTWENVTTAQQALLAAVTGTLTCEVGGVELGVTGRPALLSVRPRGLHLVEKHALVDGAPVPASFFDVGLFLANAARALVVTRSHPYLNLPKLEHHLEARLWDDVLSFVEDALGLGRAAIKVTVLIETLPAAFQTHEIVHALRRRIVGLDLGRWDYLLSGVRALRAHRTGLLPDSGQLATTQAALRALTRVVVGTCRRRGIRAVGAGSRDVADRGDHDARHAALSNVRQEAVREARAGHDGTLVAHPRLVSLARRAFDENPRHLPRREVGVGARELLAPPVGACTAVGLRRDVTVALRYLEAWLRGEGRLIHAHRVVDAASAELARARLWQRVRRRARLDDGTEVTAALLRRSVDEELATVAKERPLRGSSGDRFDEARDLLLGAALDERPSPALTVEAYDRL